MSRYRLTRLADTDLEDIWLFLATRNPTAADRLLDTLYDRFVLLARQPLIGHRREDLGPNIRSFPVGSYLIFYQPTEEGIEVVRVVHGARDISRLL